MDSWTLYIEIIKLRNDNTSSKRRTYPNYMKVLAPMLLAQKYFKLKYCNYLIREHQKITT